MKIRIIALLLSSAFFAAWPVAAADLDGNGRIDRGDVEAMKAVFYTANPRADLDGNGIVNFGDLAMLRAAFDRGSRAMGGAMPLGTGLPIISLLPVTQDIGLVQIVEMELHMDFSPDPTLGGGLDIQYDPSRLTFLGFEFDAAFPDEPEFRNFPDTSDPGVLGSLAFGHFDGMSGPHLVGRLSFQAIGLGTSDLTMDDDADGSAGPFVSAVTFMPQQVDFFGAQVNVVEAPLGVIAVDPLSVLFPATLLGEQSFADVTVTNIGDADLTIGQVAAVDPLVAPFSIQTDACSLQILPPAGACIVSLVFSANVLGTFANTFDVPSDDFFNTSVTVSVEGTGIPVPEPEISVQPANFGFGNLSIGEIAETDIVVSNLGTADLVILGVAMDDPLNAPFSLVADGCTGQTVVPNDNCTLSAQFAPTNRGIFTDFFDITSNDPDQPVFGVALQGHSTADVSALIIGIFTGAAQCDNLTTGQSVPVPLAGVKFFNCEEQGLDVSAGDSIRIFVRGITPSPVSIGGVAQGVNLLQVLCRNATNDTSVTIQPVSRPLWDCVAEGFATNPLDEVRMAIWGIAN